MGLIRDTLKKEIDVSSNQKYISGTAEIVEYNEVSNTASINYTNPFNGTKMYRANAPILMSTHGFFGYNIMPGDTVSVTFSNGNIHSPMITGIIGSDYTNMNTSNSGSCIISDKTQRATLPEDFTPMSNDWFDFDNQNPDKYINQYSMQYYDNDCFATVCEIARKITYHSDGDQGVTSVINGSTVTIRENGDIEMFVSNNVGMRISRADQKIYLYGLTVEKAGQE